MKLAPLIPIVISKLALAQHNATVDERKLSHILAMSFNQVTTSHSQVEFGKMLLNYGCHCFPESGRSINR